MQGSLHLVLEGIGAPVPELLEVEAAVEDRGRVDPADSALDAGREPLAVRAREVEVVTARAGDGLVGGEACFVEETPAELIALALP